MNLPLRSDEAVSGSLAADRPVVALESTIFSNLGLPDPHNREALDRVLRALRDRGVTPGLTAVLDGEVWCGVPPGRHPTICGPAQKVAWRDIAVAVANQVSYGATTVSASLAIAATFGVRTFATGGLGGVHRGWSESGDVSADLAALAAHRVVAVSAGAKSFLDLAATLERLETLSVPVLGWQTDEFPAFYARSSGLGLGTSVDSADQVAAIAQAHWELGGGGVLVVNPVPEAEAIELAQLDAWTARALELEGLSAGSLAAAAVSGPEVTPQVLTRLVELSEGRTLTANLALAENNAAVAAGIATALAVGSAG